MTKRWLFRRRLSRPSSSDAALGIIFRAVSTRSKRPLYHYALSQDSRGSAHAVMVGCRMTLSRCPYGSWPQSTRYGLQSAPCTVLPFSNRLPMWNWRRAIQSGWHNDEMVIAHRRLSWSATTVNILLGLCLRCLGLCA